MSKNFKCELLAFIIREQKSVLDTAISAAQQAHETATSPQNVAENKYDTLGLEAAYLAEGQSRRVDECLNTIKLFELMKPLTFDEDESIQLGALIQIRRDNGEEQWLYLGPAAGGFSFQYIVKDDVEINIKLITPSSPIGKSLVGLYEGDEFRVQIGHTEDRYEVMAIL